jgi:hypothetical protein
MKRKLFLLILIGPASAWGDVAQYWTPHDSNRSWRSVASSADGNKLVAVESFGQIYTSTDSGTNWTARDSNRNWYSVASSADGSKLVAVVQSGQIYTSTDSGTNWTARDSSRVWNSVASSADGSKLVAVVYNGGQIYTSTDSGTNWTARDSNRSWFSVASSADGSKLVAVVGVASSGQIYTSTDSGTNWTARDSNRNWYSVASSTDGSKLVAVVQSGQIYTSTDSGTNWTARESGRNWYSVASSADGSKLVAVVNGGQIYTSTDSGTSWTARESNRGWTSVASSAGGDKLVAVVYSGQIYTSDDAANVWTNVGNGKWEVGSNWSHGAPSLSWPANLITNTNSKTVTIDATTAAISTVMTANNLTVSAPLNSTNTLSLNNAGLITPLRILDYFTLGANGVLIITNSALRVDGGSGGAFSVDGTAVLNTGTMITTNASTFIGNSGLGQMTLSNGTWLAGAVTLAQGTLTVAGGTNSFGGQLVVGNATTGTVWVTGGQLLVTNAVTYIGSSGAGSLTQSNGFVQVYNEFVGFSYGGQGTLTVAGGTNSCGGQLVVGNDSSTTGTVWVTGGQLLVTNAVTYIGSSGAGSLTQSNGFAQVYYEIVGVDSQGTLTVAGGTNIVGSGGLVLGYNPGGAGTVWVTGGRLVVTNAVTYIGRYGVGSLTQSNGFVQVYGENVGFNNGSSGTLTVAGGTNIVGSGELVVGYNSGSTGRVWVTGGQLVLTNSGTYISWHGVGQLTISNSVVLARDVWVANTYASPGTITLAAGTLNTTTLQINTNGVLRGCGTVTGNVTVNFGGTNISDCGNLSFTGIVTNNGTMIAASGAVLEFYAPVVNSGLIDVSLGDAIFHSTITNINNGAFTPKVNSWTNSLSGKWETGANWLRGAPSSADAANLIANTSSKTVTIDATTAGISAVMTITNLTVSAPLNSTNTLSLNNAGLITPLRILTGFTLGANGVLLVTNSALRVDGLSGGAFSVDGTVVLNTGTMITTNASTFIGNSGLGQMTVSNSTWLAGAVTLAQGTLTVADSTNTLTGPLWIQGTQGMVWVTGGQLTVTNVSTQISIGGYGLTESNGTVQTFAENVTGTLTVAGGTNTVGSGGLTDNGTVWVTGGQLVATNVNTIVGSFGAGKITVSNGTWLAQGVVLGGQSASAGLITVAGGTNIVGSGGLILKGGVVPLGFGSAFSNSTVWVTGGQLLVTNGPTILALYGGQMTVSNGAVTMSSLIVTNYNYNYSYVDHETLDFISFSYICTNRFTLSGGVVNSAGAAITNDMVFAVGDGTDAATYHMLGGVHSFANGLRVRNNATLSGCGTITGPNDTVTVDAGGTVVADCGGTLAFGGSLTNVSVFNNGTMVATNGSVLESYGIVVNNGTINVGNGTFSFHGGFINNGTIIGGSATNSYIGKWEGNANWSLGMAPSANDLADVITNAPNRTVTIDASTTGSFPATMTINNLLVSANTLQLTNAGTAVPLEILNDFDISAGGALLIIESALRVDAGLTINSGTMTVASGTNRLSQALIIGRGGGGTGAVWVTGGQLVVTNGLTTVGESGIGQMTVSNGTALCTNVIVGAAAGASGALTVAGGTNQLSGSLTIGQISGATGAVWVTGGRFVATASPFTVNVGNSGVGQMTVSNGTALCRFVNVGNNAGSSGTLTVAGGTNQISSTLFVSTFAGATGAVWVTGGRLTSSIIFAGRAGVGQMAVSNGTTVCTTLTVGGLAGGSGTLTVAGGTNSINNGLTLGTFDCTATGIVNVVGGELDVTNALGTAVLEVRSGTFTLNSGTVMVDKFVMTNACGHFTRTGGTLIYGSAVLDPNLSAGGSGIPNGWALQYGLDPFDPNLANEDPDGDGCNNLCEYLAGGNPVADIKAITKEGINIRVRWQAAATKTNALQRSPGVNGSYSNNFADIFTVTNNIGSVTNYLDNGAATNKPALYYRIRLVP